MRPLIFKETVMLKDNLIKLRGIHGYSQEQVAEQIGISRQAYAKWETGATVPDIEKCRLIALVYGVTIDSLVDPESDDIQGTALVPKGKNIWGSITINGRGQVVIPKETREKFSLTGGTRLIVLSDEEGIALIPAEKFEEHLRKIMELAVKPID